MTLLLRLLPYVALMAVSGWLGYEWRDRAADAELATLVADHATALAEAQKAARDAEQAAALRVAQIAEQYEQDKRNALAVKDRTIADLRAGRIELRDEWRGCETARVSEQSRSAAELDAEAAARERLAAEIVQVGREADDWIKRLQDYAREVSK